MGVSAFLFLLLLIGAWGYQLLALVSLWRFFRSDPAPPPATNGPGITVFKPLKGLTANTRECLTSFLTQEYRPYQVLFGVQDLVVVHANGRILVMPTERAAAMKQLLDALHAGANFGPKTLGAHQWWRLVTSMFMHGGIAHIFGNMLYLWIFGDNLEDSMGHIRYLIFYLTCGILSGLTHVFVTTATGGNPYLPALGASGAISGVLAG